MQDLDIMPNLSAYMEEYPEFAARLKDDEGYIYSLSQFNESPDNYMYQNRRFNGTFAIDELLKQGMIIHKEA